MFECHDHRAEGHEDERNDKETRLSRFILDLTRVRIRRNRHYNFRCSKATCGAQCMCIISRMVQTVNRQRFEQGVEYVMSVLYTVPGV